MSSSGLSSSHSVFNQPAYLVRTGKELRRRYRNPNLPDGALWQYLRGDQLGVRVRQQVPVSHPSGDMVVDYMIKKHKLVIELAERDPERERRLVDLGFKVLWFPRQMALLNPDDIVTEIKTHLR